MLQACDKSFKVIARHIRIKHGKLHKWKYTYNGILNNF